MPGHGNIRRILGVLVVIFILLCTTAAQTDGKKEAMYTAKSNLEFHLRPEPDSRRWVGVVPANQRVEVLEYGEEWCLLRYNTTAGYAQTQWLREFISQDPAAYPLPGYAACSGMWTFGELTRISAGEFGGLTVEPGTTVAIRQNAEGMVLPVWRDVMPLTDTEGSYTAFIPWERAEAGDRLTGFTTYYNEKYGAPLARERQENIELACRLMNGHVIEAGEGFSFNAVCGPYVKRTGYKVAKNISKSGTGTGGGVCQVSTTLYNALLGIPVRVTEWEVHSVKGVKYVPVAFDACVGLYSDLCFLNTLPYALRLEAEAQSGALTVQIYRQD